MKAIVSWFLFPITWCINHEGSPLRKEVVSYLLARVRSLFRKDFTSVSLQKDLTGTFSPVEEGSGWWGFFVFLRFLLLMLLIFAFLLLMFWSLDIAVLCFCYHISFCRELFFTLLLLLFSNLWEHVFVCSLLCLYVARISFLQESVQRDPLS